MTSGRVPAVALALLLCIAGAMAYLSTAASTPAMDFYQIWIGARMARQADDFYDPATGARMGEAYRQEAVAQGGSERHVAVATFRRNLEMFSTPLLYTTYAPLRGSYDRDLTIFQLVVFVSLLVWVTVFARVSGWDTTGTLLLIAYLLLAFEPLRSDVRVGNVNQIVLAVVALAALLTVRERFVGAGALLALATLLKPNVALIFPVVYLFWVVQRRWRDLARHAGGAAAMTLVAVLVSSLYYGSATIWLEWITALRAMPDSVMPLEAGNVAPVLVLRELTGFNLSFLILIAAVAALVFVARRGPRDHLVDVGLIATGCLLFQLTSPLVWLHYVLLAVPLTIWLLRPSGREGVARRQIAGAVALALISAQPWLILLPDVIQVASFITVGLVLAFAGVLYDLGSQSADRPSA